MTLRAAITAALTEPLTGAQIRERIGPVGSVALHRYLHNMRDRGYLSARRIDGVWMYAPVGYEWPVRESVWDWRMAA